MTYDVYISYSRDDDREDRVTTFIEKLRRAFEEVAGRPLRVFFDITKPHPEFWREEVLDLLHESKLFVALISPSYLDDEKCAFEFDTFLKLTEGRSWDFGRILPVAILETPDFWESEFLAQRRSQIVSLFTRHHWDMRTVFAETDVAHDQSLRDLVREIKVLLLQAELDGWDVDLRYETPGSAGQVQYFEHVSPTAEYCYDEAEFLYDDAPATEQADTPAESDEVVFTVYRRKTILPEKWYPLLAFAYLSDRPPDLPLDELDPADQVKLQAATLLGHDFDQYKDASQESSKGIPREGELTFRPYVEGIKFNPESRTFRWEESVHREEFKMRATKQLDGNVAKGWMRVYLGPLLVAQINMSFKVDSKTQATDIAPQSIDHGRPLRKVFASYSHLDKEIVERIEKIISQAHLGIEYLRDATKLRVGEVWNDRLMRMIDEADMFQLFWSNNAMKSKYVQQEYEYAISRRRQHFILPVYWEEPFPEDKNQGLPPEALRRLQFEKLTPADSADAITRELVLPPAFESTRDVSDRELHSIRHATDGARRQETVTYSAPASRDVPPAELVPMQELMNESEGDYSPSTYAKSSLPPITSQRMKRIARRRTPIVGIIAAFGILLPIVSFAMLGLMVQGSSGTASSVRGIVLLLVIFVAVAGLVVFLVRRYRR